MVINNNIFLCIIVKPFIIGDGLVNIIVKKGQVIKYDIKYAGEPEPEVVWLQDKTELKEDAEQRITIDKYDRNTVLTTRRVVRADSGKYCLRLTNSSGVCESMADVVVLGAYNINDLIKKNINKSINPSLSLLLKFVQKSIFIYLSSNL